MASDGIYVLFDITDDTQKTKDRVPRNIILSKISFDGKQTDKIILKGVDKIINLMLSANGKTLIAEIAYGYIVNKEKNDIIILICGSLYLAGNILWQNNQTADEQ